MLLLAAFPVKEHSVKGYSCGNAHVKRTDMAGHGDTDQFIGHTQYGVRDPFVLSTHHHHERSGQVRLFQ
jgi:hypothetical protein